MIRRFGSLLWMTALGCDKENEESQPAKLLSADPPSVTVWFFHI